MQRILIVSQDAAHIRAAEAAARADSRIVRSEATSEGCLIAVREWRPALVILDLAIGLTSGGLAALMRDEAMADGVATLAIAAASQLPLVNSGVQVDDFIMTPVDEDELRIRLSRLVREQSGADESNVIRHGPLIIDLERYKVTIDSDVVDLTYKEYELLRFLASNPGKPFTREALLNQVWGYDYYGGSRTVDVHVRRIRAKIESREMFIDTVRNVGYRFVETYQAARRGASR